MGLASTTKHIKTITFLLAATLLLAVPPAPAALATPPVVHDIADCAALNTLGANGSTSADTINLTADLDCTGVSFTPMYPFGYSGIFEGNGHSISHLTINAPGSNNIGLFSGVSGGTIQNLVLASGSITGGTTTGALVGGADHLTVSNVTSAVSVTSAASITGGLIGLLNGSAGSLIEDVTVTGAVTNTGGSGSDNVGGLIGYLQATDHQVTLRRVAHITGTITSGQNGVGGLVGYVGATGTSAAAGVTIQDSYTAGTLSTASSVAVGGLIGVTNITGNGNNAALDLTRVYASAAASGTQIVGGLVGYGYETGAGATLVITDSFAVGSVAAASYTGGLVGQNAATITTTNSFYDGPGTGQTVCSGGASLAGTCTRIDTGVTPNYFKTTHANPPLDNWDFATVWSTVPGGYPTLIPFDDGDNVAQADETAGPNSGDANNDGINDAAQATVASLPDPVSGHYAVLETSCGSLFNTEVGAESTTTGQTDVAYTYPGGLIRFVATGCTPGATATVTQYFYGLDATAQYTLRKSTGSGTYATVSGATFSAVTIGGQSALKVVYQVTDGSSLDDDGAADGNITDPAGPAVLVVGVPNTGLGGQPAGER